MGQAPASGLGPPLALFGGVNADHLRHARPIPPAPGELVWARGRSLWLTGMLGVWLAFGVQTASVQTVALWAVSTALTLCLGHSVGLHRGVIHRAFRMGKTLETALVYLATLCGMGGPIMMFRMHELRDHWQNQRMCPAYFSYGHGLARDFLWYLHVDYEPRNLSFEPRLPMRVAQDPIYRFLDRTWMLQQLPWAVILYAAFGLGGVVWGVAARVSTSVLGHWVVNYFAHTRGEIAYELQGGEEGRNCWVFGALSMGEGWHNNHHAYPESARIGIRPLELDPGWIVILALRRLGLVWRVKTPAQLTLRAGGQVREARAADAGVASL